MITTAPLLIWSDLRRALRHEAPHAATTAPWVKSGDMGFLTPRSAWALAAVAAAVTQRQGRPARVLLPGWICNQSLWPLRQTGAALEFLPVRPDGGMDWRDTETLGAVDVVVVVHTFGQAAELEPARAFADSRGALLIEDAAHALMPGPGLHACGDVVLYSPHKLLAVPEGGIMVVRSRAEGWADAFAEALGQPVSAPDNPRWLGRRLIQRLIPDTLRPHLPQGGQEDFTTDPVTRPMAPPAAPSRLARQLLAACHLEREAARRLANARALREVVGRLDDLRPLYPADENAPYRLALRAPSPQVAAMRYRALRRAHLPVETWPDLPPEVNGDSRHAHGALALRHTVLLLPVHGALSPERLAEAYSKVLKCA